MRKPFIVGNWKMNMLQSEAIVFVEQLNNIPSYVEVGVAAQAISLTNLVGINKNILIGAQNVNDQLAGAYTGEISVELLKEAKVDFCIIGHSERRAYYNESDEKVNEKAKLLIERDITPIICVGESLEQYESKQTEEVIINQISIACANLAIEQCVIAYEPIWAIGTGKSATSQIAQAIALLIRNQLTKMYSLEQANKVRIQYGGSVKPTNIKEYMDCPDVDGALVGGASLKLEDFKQLINYEEN